MDPFNERMIFRQVEPLGPYKMHGSEIMHLRGSSRTRLKLVTRHQ